MNSLFEAIHAFANLAINITITFDNIVEVVLLTNFLWYPSKRNSDVLVGFHRGTQNIIFDNKF